jgi:hypothetical protein
MTSKIVKVIDLVPAEVRPLTTVRASALDANGFWTEFVCQHRPVLIRGAAAEWPALQHWGKPGYLEALCGDEVAGMSRTFNPLPGEAYFETAVRSKKLLRCITEMRAAPDDATYSIPAQPVPPTWQKDLGAYGFLSDTTDKRPSSFPRQRLFIYKNASTDWHYHATDETLTAQLVGSKRIGLFRLTHANWRLYAQTIRANFHHMPCSKEFFPRQPAVVKYEGILNPGDAIYIPPFWWHGVDPVDAAVGVTMAHCFRTPIKRLGDLKEPVIREFLRTTRRRNVPLVFSMVVFSTLRRRLAGEKW